MHAGARVGMVFSHALPDGDGGIRLPEGGEGFGQGHERIAVIVLGRFGANRLEQRECVRGPFLAQQALPEVRAGVDVLWIAFEGGAVTGFGFVELALLEIDVAQLEIMMRLVQVMNLRLKLADAAPVVRARQFETLRR